MCNSLCAYTHPKDSFSLTLSPCAIFLKPYLFLSPTLTFSLTLFTSLSLITLHVLFPAPLPTPKPPLPISGGRYSFDDVAPTGHRDPHFSSMTRESTQIQCLAFLCRPVPAGLSFIEGSGPTLASVWFCWRALFMASSSPKTNQHPALPVLAFYVLLGIWP
ncbi:hypothetical protein Ddc_10237 [Ditylenchus destructor]|nr:hypothetical protein Ddc_10237 [Ditylenchus destructor]